MSDILSWFNAEHLGYVVVIASALSNLIPPHTIVGKALHFVALNLSNLFKLPGSGGPAGK